MERVSQAWTHESRRTTRPAFLDHRTRAIVVCLAWLSLIAVAILRLGKSDGTLLAVLLLLSVALTVAVCVRAGRGLGKRVTANEYPRNRSEPVLDDSSLENLTADALLESPLADARTRSGLFDAPPVVSSGSKRAAIVADA
ncbi:MAG TPA: hypothetical protein VJY33_15570, partial [Isosphaeraceae bacterium]|nr:hypothetical protein [Isosphaeraceae bacterium]